MNNKSLIESSTFTGFLTEGSAQYMGDGIFVVCQRDEGTSEMRDVILSVQAIGTSQDRTVPLETAWPSISGTTWGWFARKTEARSRAWSSRARLHGALGLRCLILPQGDFTHVSHLVPG